MNRATANLLLLITGAIWGMGFVAQSTAMDAIGPILFTGVRFLASGLAVLPLAILEARRAKAPLLPRGREWTNYMVLGALIFAALGTQQIGIVTTSVTNSGFLTGLYVVFTPLIGILIFRLLPHPVVWPAALLSLAGIYLLSGGSLTGLNRGDWWTILCAVLWACHVQTVGKVVRNGRPLRLACLQFFICAAIGITLAPLVEPVGWRMIVEALPEILFAGVVSGGIAFTLQAFAQVHTTPPQAAIFMSSEALFAALLGALLLGERIGPAGFVGCGLIFAAMMAVELVPMMRERRRAAG